MPPKPKTDQQKQELRMMILDAARDMFIERGIEAVTMREVARRIGYSATTLYIHFKDKEALLRELCDTDFLLFARKLHTFGNIKDPVDRLRQLGLQYAQFAIECPNHYRLMFMTPQMLKDADKSSIETGNPEQDAYAGLRAVVGEAFNEGRFRPELKNPDLIAQVLWAGLHGVCSLEITKSNDSWVDWQPLQERIALMQEVLLSGLLKGEKA